MVNDSGSMGNPLFSLVGEFTEALAYNIHEHAELSSSEEMLYNITKQNKVLEKMPPNNSWSA